jgi:hypothetical protein
LIIQEEVRANIANLLSFIPNYFGTDTKEEGQQERHELENETPVSHQPLREHFSTLVNGNHLAGL